MKPEQLRHQRQARERQAAVRGERLEAVLRGDEAADAVRPELIPGGEDLAAVTRECRKLMRRAERTPRGSRRDRVLDELVVEMMRLVYVERVMELDPLERAALTPARLAEMSKVGPLALQSRLARWQGETGIEVPS